MKKPDLMKMCVQNLTRRKTRTFLTTLGVLIGCCSIVIMVSIGFGMQEQQEQMMKSFGDLTLIKVTQEGDTSDHKIDQNLVDEIEQMNGVAVVSPKKVLDSYTVHAFAGLNNRFQTDYMDAVGIDTGKINEFDYKLLEGTSELNEGEVLVGRNFVLNFKDSLRPEGSNTAQNGYLQKDEIPEGFFDPLAEKITLEISKSDNTGSSADTDGSSTEKKAVVKLKPVGYTAEDYNKGTETVDGMIMSLNDFQNMINQLSTPGTTDTSYDSVMVKVSDISMVEPVENAIRQQGFNTESMTSMRKDLEDQARHTQMMFAGIGAISLFVAALGIMNTMIMSISERTREIGIMKSLGCYISDIRMMFLTEAGIIGLIGGAIGCVISFAVSAVINISSLGGFSMDTLKAAILGGEGITRVSIIPIWLYVFAIGFSILIGVASGYYPANKAVKIPALEAIKSE
ncbi:MAG: ABC transporter permease [Lachnospiraceae bacterium]|nr:ABC transporter permease [Lachnospiraceae bacterium]